MGGTRAGFLSFTITDRTPFGVDYGEWPASPFVWVSNVFVEPGCRRGGVGRALYARVEALARAKGLRSVMCDVYKSNPESMGFHERLGYVPRVVIMEKLLA